MPEKILFVDDDPAILSAFMRMLRHETLSRDYPSLPPFVVETAPGGPEALAAMRAARTVAVIVSDLRMPGMDGVQLLEETRTVSPRACAILLTGQGDIETAIEAVNRGGLFRFLTKPCPPETLVPALDAALQQYLLVTAERQLLDETLAGSVKVITEVLSLVNPTAFSRALRVRRIVHHIVERLSLADAWQLEVASLLSQIGYLTLGVEPGRGPTARPVLASSVSSAQTHPAAARDLLANIPRLGQVAAIVGAPAGRLRPGGRQNPAGPARSRRSSARRCCAWRLSSMRGCAVACPRRRRCRACGCAATSTIRGSSKRSTDIAIPAMAYVPRRLPVADLRSGMVLDQDVRNEQRAAAGLARPRGHAAAADPAALARLERRDCRAAQGTWRGRRVKLHGSEVRLVLRFDRFEVRPFEEQRSVTNEKLRQAKLTVIDLLDEDVRHHRQRLAAAEDLQRRGQRLQRARDPEARASRRARRAVGARRTDWRRSRRWTSSAG